MDTKFQIFEKGAIKQIGKLIKNEFPKKKVLLIADGNTYKVAGKEVENSLRLANIEFENFIFPSLPVVYADEESIEIVAKSLKKNNSFIALALGSGSLNDICKRASEEVLRPYVVVATAPSVDGYTSYGAAVSINGFKKTLPCKAPFAVFADPEVLSKAPMKMIASGFADSLAKFTAGADWIVADQLKMVPIKKDVWNMVQPSLIQTYSLFGEIADRKPEGINTMFETLSQSGLAMQVMQDSRPASGAEHLISHVWEMDHLCMEDGLPVSHGFKVSIGTLFIAFCYNKFWELNNWKPLEEQTKKQRIEDIKKTFEGNALEKVLPIALEKFVESKQTRRLLILEKMNIIKEKTRKQLPPFEEMRKRMQLVGCPVSCSEINIKEKDDLRKAVVGAQMMRNRYTLLDLLYDMGQYKRVTGEWLDEFWDLE